MDQLPAQIPLAKLVNLSVITTYLSFLPMMAALDLNLPLLGIVWSDIYDSIAHKMAFLYFIIMNFTEQEIYEKNPWKIHEKSVKISTKYLAPKMKEWTHIW